MKIKILWYRPVTSMVFSYTVKPYVLWNRNEN